MPGPLDDEDDADGHVPEREGDMRLRQGGPEGGSVDPEATDPAHPTSETGQRDQDEPDFRHAPAQQSGLREPEEASPRPLERPEQLQERAFAGDHGARQLSRQRAIANEDGQHAHRRGGRDEDQRAGGRPVPLSNEPQQEEAPQAHDVEEPLVTDRECEAGHGPRCREPEVAPLRVALALHDTPEAQQRQQDERHVAHASEHGEPGERGAEPDRADRERPQVRMTGGPEDPVDDQRDRSERDQRDQKGGIGRIRTQPADQRDEQRVPWREDRLRGGHPAQAVLLLVPEDAGREAAAARQVLAGAHEEGAVDVDERGIVQRDEADQRRTEHERPQREHPRGTRGRPFGEPDAPGASRDPAERDARRHHTPPRNSDWPVMNPLSFLK